MDPRISGRALTAEEIEQRAASKSPMSVGNGNRSCARFADQRSQRMDNLAMDKLPPHNRDAERSLLSSMLRDNRIIADVVPLVRAENFYIYAHQKIFDAITKLSDARKAADIVTVAEWLATERLIDEIGGHAYLGDLWDAARAPPITTNMPRSSVTKRSRATLSTLARNCSPRHTIQHKTRRTFLILPSVAFWKSRRSA